MNKVSKFHYSSSKYYNLITLYYIGRTEVGSVSLQITDKANMIRSSPRKRFAGITQNKQWASYFNSRFMRFSGGTEM